MAMKDLPALEAHFVVVFDSETNSWSIDPDNYGSYFANGEVYFPTLEEWRVVNDDDPILEDCYVELAQTLFNKLNDKVGA